MVFWPGCHQRAIWNPPSLPVPRVKTSFWMIFWSTSRLCRLWWSVIRSTIECCFARGNFWRCVLDLETFSVKTFLQLCHLFSAEQSPGVESSKVKYQLLVRKYLSGITMLWITWPGGTPISGKPLAWEPWLGSLSLPVIIHIHKIQLLEYVIPTPAAPPLP